MGRGLGSTTGTTVRITPQNFREVLGPNADVLMTPQNTRDLFEKGYLDVKRTFTEDTSSEGALSILAKSIGALIGPSKSLGAMSIDPKFMQMIKDPSAEIGFGTTSVRAEQLEVLSSPADPAIQEEAPPDDPQPVPPPQGPQRPRPHPEEPEDEQWNPVDMSRPQINPVDPITPEPPQLVVDAVGTYKHDSSVVRTNDQGEVDALRTGHDSGAFEISIDVNSNVLHGAVYNTGLSQRRGDAAASLLHLTPEERQNNVSPASDNKHRRDLASDFNLEITGEGSTGTPHKVKIADPNGPQPSNNFMHAAQDLIDKQYRFPDKKNSPLRSVLQSDSNISRPDPRVEAIAKKNHITPTISDGSTPPKQITNPEYTQLYDYAQSFMNHRSFDAHVTITDFGKAEQWLEANKGNAKIAGSDVYKQVQGQVEQWHATQSGQSGANDEAVETVSGNFDRVTAEPDPNADPEIVPAKEDVQAVIDQIDDVLEAGGLTEEQESDLLTKRTELTERLDSTPTAAANAETRLTNDLNEIAVPGTVLDADDNAHLDKLVRDAGGATKPTTHPITIGERTFPAGTRLGDIVQYAKDIAGSGPSTQPGEVYDSGDITAQLDDDLGKFETFAGQVSSGQSVNPVTIANYADNIRENIALLRQPGATDPPIDEAVIQGYEDRLRTLEQTPGIAPNPETGDKGLLAAGRAEKATGTSQYPRQINDSFKGFQTYLKAAVKDGKINYDEQAKIQSFVDTTARNMAIYLRDQGVPGFENADKMNITDVKAKLSQLNAEGLKAAGIPDAEATQLVETLEKVTTAQASINLAKSEGPFTSSLYNNVRALNQRLDEFESVGVVKTAFANEMKGMAEQVPPAAFNTLMETVYGLPPCPETCPDEADDPQNYQVFKAYEELQTQAKNGTLAFPPNVGFVDRAELGGANGAYIESARDPDNPNRAAAPTILLARDLLDHPDRLRDVFTEEMFHHLEHTTQVQQLAQQGAQERYEAADAKIDELIGPLNNIADTASRQGTPIRAALDRGDYEGAQELLADKIEAKMPGLGREKAMEYASQLFDPVSRAQLDVVATAEQNPALQTALGTGDRAGVVAALIPALKAKGLNDEDAREAAETLILGEEGEVPLELDQELPLGLIDYETNPVDLPDENNVTRTGALQTAQAAEVPTERLVSQLKEARRDRREASNDIKTGQAGRDIDTRGDEGRVALLALRSYRANGSDLGAMVAAGERGRMQTAQVSGNFTRLGGPKDQGIVNENGINAGGRQIAGEGTVAEFSSGGSDEPAALPGHGDGTIHVRPERQPGDRSAVDYAANPQGLQGVRSLNPNRSAQTPMQKLPAEARREAIKDRILAERAGPNSGTPQENIAALQDMKTKLNATPPGQVNPNELAARIERTRAQIAELAKKPENKDQVQALTEQLEALGQNAQGAPDTAFQEAYSKGSTKNEAAIQEAQERAESATGSSWAGNFGTPETQQTVKNEYKEEKSTMAQVGEAMMDAVPRGLQAVGKLLVNCSEQWQALIHKLFKDIGKPATIAEKTIYGDQGGPWDTAADVGKPEDDLQMKNVHRFDEVTNANGPPDYDYAKQLAQQGPAQARIANDLQLEKRRQQSYFERG
ncbi:MAG: hypothetical protein ACAI44_26895 [Candidatus Sericytochromatia bacterium]